MCTAMTAHSQYTYTVVHVYSQYTHYTVGALVRTILPGALVPAWFHNFILFSVVVPLRCILQFALLSVVPGCLVGCLPRCTAENTRRRASAHYPRTRQARFQISCDSLSSSFHAVTCTLIFLVLYSQVATTASRYHPMAAQMETDDLPVVLPSSTTSGLSLALHPLPILNVSEHLTRMKLQTRSNSPFVIGALLGTQNGREVEIVNTFELAMEADGVTIDSGFLVARKDQYKQVFPSLEFIGWYTVAPQPTAQHIALHEQFTAYSSTPLLLMLQPSSVFVSDAQSLPFKAYEPTIEIRDRKSRSVFVEASYTVETGEAERIAVDWTAKGGSGGTSLESHLQSQRAAVKMLHDRILLLVKYVTEVIAGSAQKDHATLRSLSALIASLPASENKEFRKEFDTEYEDVQLTAYLSTLTKSASILNDLVDRHVVLTANREDRGPMGPSRRRGMGRSGHGGGMGGMGYMGGPMGMMSSLSDWR